MEKKKNGGRREGAGRKPKSVEQGIVEKLSPMSPKAFKALEEAIEEGKPWAIKLWVEHVYGKAVETKDIRMTGETPIFKID